MFHLEDFGVLALGSRLKRLSDLLFRQADELYKERNINLPARSFPVLQLLAANGDTSVTRLAEQLGQTHPAISQMSKKMEANGWLYFETDGKDERKRLLSLTPQGYELVDKLNPLWGSLREVIDGILKVSGHGLISNIELLERELAKESLAARVGKLERQSKIDKVEIIHYLSNYLDDFYRLNRHWLEKFFYMEAIDQEVLSNPQENILDPGGFILLARLEGKIVGTAALIVGENASLELSKMAVDEDYQGLGIGEKLAKAAIDQYKATDFKCLFLESNRKLLPALNLYQKLGFREEEPPFDQSHYNRADIYMVYQEDL